MEGMSDDKQPTRPSLIPEDVQNAAADLANPRHREPEPTTVQYKLVKPPGDKA